MITPVKHIMTKKLITVSMGSSLFEAYALMNANRIRHLPVVDSMEDIVGILSHRDLNVIPDFKNIPVEWMMSSPVEYVDQNTSLRKTIFLMLQKKISCLLIADEEENAIGIVTTDDLLWHLAHLLEDETEEKPLLSIAEKQTIGEVVNELSLIGI
ncbi:MAG: CBS domain-containing protein [Pseudobdellovibrionaceae bacterium]